MGLKQHPNGFERLDLCKDDLRSDIVAANRNNFKIF